MDRGEAHAQKYLRSLGLGSVIHEPVTNSPPDFLVDGRIAAEVTRLNQALANGDGCEDLSEVDIPLFLRVRRVLRDLGSPIAPGTCWYVNYYFERPLPRLRKVEAALRQRLQEIRDTQPEGPVDEELVENFRVRLWRGPSSHDEEFRLGVIVDEDSGGLLIQLLKNNVSRCARDKAAKIAPFFEQYEKWWLVLIDQIGLDLSPLERELLRSELEVPEPWDQVVVLNPGDHTRAFELGRRLRPRRANFV